MKIGFDAISITGFGGVVTYTQNLIFAFLKKIPEVEVHLFTAFGRSIRLKRIFGNPPRLKIQTCLLHPGMIGKHMAPLLVPINRFIWNRLASKLDMIHYTDPFRFPRVQFGNFVATIHDMVCYYDWLKPHQGSHRRVIAKTLKNTPLIVKNARRIFVPTEFVKRDLLRYFPQAESRVQVIHEAANSIFRMISADWEQIRKYNLSPDTPFFLYVGGFVMRKNMTRLLEAYHSLPNSVREEFRLVCVGGGSKEEMAIVHAKIDELSLWKNFIHLQGISDEDLVSLYNAAFATVYVSLSEGFGLPVLEAMQCGCPVITSNCSAMAEVAGDAALLVDPHSVESIRDGMLRLIDDPPLRSSLVEKGLKRAKHFSWEKTARETYQGYEAVLNEEFS